MMQLQRNQYGQVVWPEEAVQYLRDNYPTMPTADIAKTLGVSKVYVCRKANLLGIRKEVVSPDGERHIPVRHVWSKEEDDRFREIFPHTPNVKCAEIFGVSHQSVSRRAMFLGLSKAADYKKKGHPSKPKPKPEPLLDAIPTPKRKNNRIKESRPPFPRYACKHRDGNTIPDDGIACVGIFFTGGRRMPYCEACAKCRHHLDYLRGRTKAPRYYSRPCDCPQPHIQFIEPRLAFK